jgi:hypothetical protein
LADNRFDGEPMTIVIELDPATEARLTAEAEARGLAVEVYAGAVLRDSGPTYSAGTGKLTIQDLDRMTTKLTQFSDTMPVLPLSANDRESYYEDCE